MKSNYKTIGELIKKVTNNRNSELLDLPLLGLHIEKRFMPSVANVIGTDMSKYQIIQKWQFAYTGMQVGRDESLHVALYDKDEPALITPAYTIFEVIDPTIILPEYLMLYLRRSESDRLGWFYSDSSVRANLDWDRFCSIELPVPDIEKQRKIVEQYNQINKAIQIKEAINNNLEQQADNIFRAWFVDYKLSKGIKPINWETVTLDEVCIVGAGGDRPDDYSEIKTPEFNIPIYSNGMENEGLYGYTKKPKITKESVTISARGTIGYTCLRLQPFVPIVRLITLTPKNERITAKYLYFAIKYLNIAGFGTTQQQITVPYCKTKSIVVPNIELINKFSFLTDSIFKNINNNKNEIEKLTDLKNTLLPKLMLENSDSSTAKLSFI